MGAFRGTITYSKFYVRGELPSEYRDTFTEAIALRAFRDLDPAEEEPQRSGWCSIEHPFDMDLTPDKVFFGDYLNLGLRTDIWRIPGALLKASMREAERSYLAEHGGDKLTRAQRKNLEELVTRELRRKVVPSMKTIDMTWSLEEGVVRFFHQSEAQHEVLFELFEKTFGLELLTDGAYMAAQERGLDESLLEAMTMLEPAPFHPQNL